MPLKEYKINVLNSIILLSKANIDFQIKAKW